MYICILYTKNISSSEQILNAGGASISPPVRLKSATAIKPAVTATSSRLCRTEDQPINKNSESDEEEKQEKKQEIKMGKKKQIETYDDDEDNRMQSPGIYISIYFFNFYLYFI